MASTATVAPAARASATSAVTSVLLPAPGRTGDAHQVGACRPAGRAPQRLPGAASERSSTSVSSRPAPGGHRPARLARGRGRVGGGHARRAAGRWPAGTRRPGRWSCPARTPRHAGLLEHRHVLVGDDAAGRHQHVAHALGREGAPVIRGRSVIWAPDRMDSPTTSTSSWTRRRDDHLGRLADAGVDDLEALVAQPSREHLGAPVMAVEARLGDEHLDGTTDHRSMIAAGMCRTGPRRVTPRLSPPRAPAGRGGSGTPHASCHSSGTGPAPRWWS